MQFDLGSNVIAELLDSLQTNAQKIQNILSNEAPLVVSDLQRDIIDNQSHCQLCEQPMDEHDEYHVHHNHITSEVIG